MISFTVGMVVGAVLKAYHSEIWAFAKAQYAKYKKK